MPATSKQPLEDNPRLNEVLCDTATAHARAFPAEGIWVGVVGGSMAPSLRAGERVRVCRAGYLWPGQGVCFRTRQGYWMVHRVVLDLGPVGWLLQVGDAGGPVTAIRRSCVVGGLELPWRLPRKAQWGGAQRLLREAVGRRLRRRSRVIDRNNEDRAGHGR